MKSKISRRPVVGLVLLVGLAAGLFAFGPKAAHKFFGRTPPGVKQLSSIEQLQADFNRDQGSTRIVMIFSPT